MKTLDEAINYYEDMAYQKDLESGFDTDNDRYVMTDKERTDCKECAEKYQQIAEWLKELKELKKQTSWIPVSERLPEENTSYLVTVKQGYIMIAIWCGIPKDWRNVIAWMPLPDPYKAENGR